MSEMSETELRLRSTHNNKSNSTCHKTDNHSQSAVMSSHDTHPVAKSDDNNHNNDAARDGHNNLAYDDDNDDDVNDDCDDDNNIGNNTAPTAGYRTKFSQSDRRNFVKLIYSDDFANSFTKNDYNNDSDNDYELDSNDSKPLLTTTSNRSKRMEKKVVEKFKLEILDETDVNEGLLSLSFQVFVPFLIAGFGTVGAGLVLDCVQHWDVFKQVSEVFILVPALLGLKGNLEMTLASRLSTQANLGHMNSSRDRWLMASGNIALIQCQATAVGFLAAVFAIAMDWLPEGEFNFHHALLLCASSLLTASIASFILGLVMICVVILSHNCNINPDNVATPIAASLGDLTTLALLAQFSNILFYTIDTFPWLCTSVLIVYLILLPVWCHISANNKYTRDVLYNGWTPVISAMAISSIGGCILDFAVSRFKGIAVFQPVINGVGGNLVAVQASRISTYLHKKSKLGILPKSDAKLCFTPCAAFFGENTHARTARILVLMVIPGHLVFTYGIRLLKAGHTSVTPLFLIIYLSAAMIQVLLLLYFAHSMILWMWKKHIDPDNSAIPYLTALGDLLGTALLALAFLLLFSLGDRDADVGD